MHRFSSNCKEKDGAADVEPVKGRDGNPVYPYCVPTREAQIKKLKSEKYDVLVIGGGCVGAGGKEWHEWI